MQPPRKRQSRFRVPAGAPAFAPRRFGRQASLAREGCPSKHGAKYREGGRGDHQQTNYLLAFRRGTLTARSLSSVGRAPTWYVGGSWFETSREHQPSRPNGRYGSASQRGREGCRVVARRAKTGELICAGSPTAEAARSDRAQCEFESRSAYQPSRQGASARQAGSP